MDALEITKEVELQPRMPAVRIGDDTPANFTGDFIFSTFLVGLSCLFPDGEKFFINILRHYKDQIEDPVLRKQISGFCGQEGIHARAHIELNEWLAEKGYPTPSRVAQAQFGLGIMQKYLPKKLQLSVTLGLEHFTATMAGVFLSNKEKMVGPWDAKMFHFWLWHGLEEAEHKGVAYDVYLAQNGGYALRIFGLLLATGIFTSQILLTQIMSLWSLRQLKWRVLKQGQKVMWGKNGLFRNMVRPWFKYFKPDFHPWQEDNRDEIYASSDELERIQFILPPTKRSPAPVPAH